MSKFLELIKIKIAKQKFFLMLAFAMTVLALIFIFSSLTFLAKSFNKALNTSLEPAAGAGFDTEGFSKLNLVK